MMDERSTLRIKSTTKLDPDRLTIVACVRKVALDDPPNPDVTSHTCADCGEAVWMSGPIRRHVAEVTKRVVVCFACAHKRADALTVAEGPPRQEILTLPGD